MGTLLTVCVQRGATIVNRIFPIVYGRQVRGPLDILKETSKKSNESIISYVLSMQEKLSEMSELARANLA